MDLRQLRYFVAVAEELNFSRAAVRLNLAQSALSTQIRQLEAEVGGPLFVRSTRRVELTAAGEALLEDARPILSSADAALLRTTAVARGQVGEIVVGSLGPAPGELLAPVLAQFTARHPDVRVEVRALAFSELVDGLRKGRADVAFLYLPLDEPDIELTPLLTEPRIVVLASTHPLATRATLSPADLEGETFITQPAPVPDAWCDFWLLVDEFGQRPPVSPHMPDNLDNWLHLIGQGEGIDTAPAIIARYYSWPEVTFVPLVDAAPAVLALARRADSTEPLLADFISLTESVSKTAARS
jgi:DNA-binding transcriptional LysR family regulator